MKHKSNRREFLRGQAKYDAIVPENEQGVTSLSVPETPTVHVSRRAMATEFELRFPDDPRKNLTELALESFEELEKVEETLSFFRPTSETSRINLLATEQPVEVEPALFDLLLLAMQLFQETAGAWDITATPLWQVWGFAKRKGRIPSTAELEDALSRVGSRFVELSPERKTIRFSRPGVKLNFGSLGKGYALDRVAERLLAGGMTDFLLHGGQSSILVRGSRRPIGLPNPLNPNRRLGEIQLGNRALGTSSSRFQSFRHEGKLYGHILDPRTGWPAQEILSATVLAPTAVLADALSTAFYVLGPQKSLDYCENHTEISAILVVPSAEKSRCEILTAGLDADEFLSSVNSQNGPKAP